MGTWNKIVKTLGKKTAVSYEADQNPREIEKANVMGFPTIKISKNGNTYDYKGSRTYDAIIHEMNSNSKLKMSGGAKKQKKSSKKKKNELDGDLSELKYLKYKAKYMHLKSQQ
jgi:hypothetical protein